MSSRKNMTKKLAVLSVVLLMAFVTACGSGSSGNAAQGNSGKDTSANSGSKSFKMWLGWTATINNDSMVQKYWREHEPNLDVQLESTQGDAKTALNLKLNTGGFDDAAIFPRDTVVDNSMVRSNLILPLEQYFNMPDKYPGLASIPKQFLDTMKDKDGHIWSIPTWYDQHPDNPWPGWASQGWFVRTDVLQKVGMTEDDLKTLDGVEKYLKLASEQKDANGNKMIPLSFLSDSTTQDENVILSTFGVTTASAGGVIPVEKKGGDYVFIYDDPQYKAAYQWMNKMYNEGLLDHEVMTDKKERYKEKNKSGRIAMNAGGFFNMDQSLWEVLDGPTEPAWYYDAIPFPKANGVDHVGYNQITNPTPQYEVYVSKKSKNLDAILKFMDYALQPKAEQQQVINEGPVGVFWNWVDKPLGQWKYINKDYETPRNSGDTAKIASTTPQLWQASSYSAEWYPWWNNYSPNDPKGKHKTIEFTEKIGKMGAIRVSQPYDMVKAKSGGVWEKYLPELEAVRTEYKAKLIMAKDDKAFESAWNDFQSALEKRAHWSELKTEWHEQLDAQSK